MHNSLLSIQHTANKVTFYCTIAISNWSESEQTSQQLALLCLLRRARVQGLLALDSALQTQVMNHAVTTYPHRCPLAIVVHGTELAVS